MVVAVNDIMAAGTVEYVAWLEEVLHLATIFYNYYNGEVFREGTTDCACVVSNNQSHLGNFLFRAVFAHDALNRITLDVLQYSMI